jgi:hypothetical protein
MTSDEKKSVARLVRETLDRLTQEKKVIKKPWLLHEVLSQKAPPEGRDADFYRMCALATVRDAVDRVVRSAKQLEEDGEGSQPALPGYEFVQPQCCIEREDGDGGLESVIVPVDLMTDDEIEGKVAQLQAQARGLTAHAKELAQYLVDRKANSRRAK